MQWCVNLQQQTLAGYSKCSLLDMLCFQYHAFITIFDAAEEWHCTGVDGAQLPLTDTFSPVVLLNIKC